MKNSIIQVTIISACHIQKIIPYIAMAILISIPSIDRMKGRESSTHQPITSMHMHDVTYDTNGPSTFIHARKTWNWLPSTWYI